MNNMVWYVYYHNINRKKISVKNIFSHGSFKRDVLKLLQTCKDKDTFANELLKNLRYYFWCRAEWEITIAPYCGGSIDEGIRADIYDQVMLNFDIFIDYVWSFNEAVKNEAEV